MKITSMLNIEILRDFIAKYILAVYLYGLLAQ